MALICFTAWMLGYPLLLWITKEKEYETRYSIEVRGASALIAIAIWVIVGSIIWSKVP